MKIIILFIGTIVISFFSYYFYFQNSFINNLTNNSKLIETNLGPIEYTLVGKNGPVLLFIHGTPGGYDQTANSNDTFRILTPSRPGYLRTSIAIGKTPFEQAEAFKELIDELHIDKVVVMGVSGGGPSSMEFAARYPERTLGLIAFEAVSYSEDYSETDADIIKASDLGLWIQLSLMSLLGDENLASSMLPNLKNRERLLSDSKNIENLKNLIWSIWPLSLRKDGFINDYEQFTNLSLPLEEIKVPTLVIHGNEDISVVLNHAEETVRRIEDAELYVVDGGDHYMSSTHSGEIDPLIEKFVIKVSKE